MGTVIKMGLIGVILMGCKTTTLPSEKMTKDQMAKEEASEQYARLWMNKDKDKYVKLGLTKKTVGYYGKGVFENKVDMCEKALWMTVSQVQALQEMRHAKRSQKSPVTNQRKRRAPRKNTKKK